MPIATGLPTDAVAAGDPAYLAFMRGAGYSESETLADAARQQSQLRRQMARVLPSYADELRIGQNAIGDQYQTSGLFRGGARMGHQVDQAVDVNRRQQNYVAGINDQIANSQSDAMRNIADLRRRAAEQAVTGRTNIAIGNANAGIG